MGEIALANQGRAAVAKPALNSSGPTETQQSVYSLSQSDYHIITSGSNGYSADPGYNLVTGMGTPVADRLIPDLISGNFPSTEQISPVSAAAIVNSGTTGGIASSPANAMNVFTALTMTGSTESSRPTDGTLAPPTSWRITTPQDLGLEEGHDFADALPAADAPYTGSALDASLIGNLAASADGNLRTAGDIA